ncbi:MAG: hypothetical protein M3347_08630, partial [Armatimonadota bacterium]|nr:hypothetical protein [Armatimonadota bacterium]
AVSSTAGTAGVITPTTVPGRAQRTPKIVRSTGAGIIGLVALAALASFAGVGGGSGTSREVLGVTAVPTLAGLQGFGGAAINVDYNSVQNPLRVPVECIVGYLIYRGTSPNFSADPGSLQEFIPNNGTSFLDELPLFVRRSIDINLIGTGTGQGGNQTQQGCRFNISVNSTFAPSATQFNLGNFFTVGGTNNNNLNTGSIDAGFNPEPVIPGVQYFYKVQAITIERREVPNPNPNPGQGNQQQNTITFNITLNAPSDSSGGATAIPLPDIASVNNNLDQLQIRIVGLCPVPFPPNVTISPGTPPLTVPCFAGVDQWNVIISRTNRFEPQDIVYNEIISNPGVNTTVGSPDFGLITLSPGDISLTGIDPADPPTRLFVRVGARNTFDRPGPAEGFIYSNRTDPEAIINEPTGVSTATSSRTFMKLDRASGRSVNGLGIPGAPNLGLGRAAPGSIRTPGRIRRNH